jgi:uncharacterized protein YndB with AHSA1/START domain/DNA-binding transcriptional ArsR family regulator
MAAYPASDLDHVFRALADPTRRALLDSLRDRKGQTLRELCAGTDMARQSVSKHLAVLEAAGLVTSVRRGREKLHYVNAAPVNEIAERWINRYDQARVEVLADLKRAVEDTPMAKPAFVYTTYIRSSPERLWQALTDPAFTQRYWRTSLLSDWRVGSTVTWENRGVTIEDPDQVVLEADPFTRLSYTWHTMTPELADAVGLDADVARAVASEPRSKVTFELVAQGEVTRLTVVHDGFEEGSRMVELISGGWPQVLSDLKTLLETGHTLRAAEPQPVAG